eukprot:TRINITY_DN30841_c0_g1_i1.p1 TRINITY_DN30841_c0_g1~~TRINITY_DN30841_c0_g1_i1.p1  ORF type:complete len:538 (+),score=122.59 TRINITY_DN30841_c0_g1_i1:76-1689(+)
MGNSGHCSCQQEFELKRSDSQPNVLDDCPDTDLSPLFEADPTEDQDFTALGLGDEDIPRVLKHMRAGARVLASRNCFTAAGRIQMISCSEGKITLEPADGLRPVQGLNIVAVLDLTRDTTTEFSHLQCGQIIQLLKVRRPMTVKGHIPELVTAAAEILKSQANDAERLELRVVRPDRTKLDVLALDLRKKGLVDEDVPWLERRLAEKKTFDVSGNDFSSAARVKLLACARDAGTDVVIELLPGMAPLRGLISSTRLDLSKREKGKALSVERIKELGPALQVLTHLERLEFRHQELQTAGLIALSSALPSLTKLKFLGLANNGLSDQDIKVLTPLLKAKVTLDLSGNKFTPKCRAELIRQAKSCSSSEQIILELATGFEPIKGLESIDNLVIASNAYKGKPMGKEGAEAISIALKELTTLQSLELRDNALGEKGMAALAPSIARLKKLTYVGLGSNHLGDRGAKELVPVLQALTGLETLGLDFNSMSKEGAFHLAPALSRLRKLKTLWLFGNNFNKDAMEQLGPTLDKLKEQGCTVTI